MIGLNPSNLSNRNQYVSINGHESGLAALNCGVPPGTVPGLHLFLLYINDFNPRLYRSLESGSGTKISDEKWRLVKSKYPENKKS